MPWYTIGISFTSLASTRWSSLCSRGDPDVQIALRLRILLLGVGDAGPCGRPTPSSCATVWAWVRVGRGHDELQHVLGVVQPRAEADPRYVRLRCESLSARMRMPRWSANFCGPERREVDRRRGRGGVLLVRGRLVLRRRVGDPYGDDAPVANRLRVVLTPEYEDPDRDTGQQADARDKPPTPLYGAEDVLNAQDSPSALQLRRKGSSGPQPKLPRHARLRQFGLLFQIEDTTERDPRTARNRRKLTHP